MIVEGVHINGIYIHWKGDFYRVQEVAFDSDTEEAWVIYYRCNKNGLFQSIRELFDDSDMGRVEVIVKQPFCRKLSEFVGKAFVTKTHPVARFKLFKQL